MLIRHWRHLTQSDIYEWKGHGLPKTVLSTGIYAPSTDRAILARAAVAFFLLESPRVRWRL
jgi:hypothetical protein